MTALFTGIVEELGHVVSAETLAGDSARLNFRGPVVTPGTGPGDSISVNGVCLTVATIHDDTFGVDVMKTTLDRSSLGGLTAGSPVNLERAMAAGGRFGGHVVQGHVDGTARIVSRSPSEHWELVRIVLPPSLARYVVDKGSITVDGVSLTVSGLDDDTFTVSLIPTTLALTTLGTKQPGDLVNLEVDVLAKYVERLLAAGAVTGQASP